MSFTPAQLRAARALLDWTQQDLAERAGINWTTVRDFEGGRRQLRPASRDAILAALDGLLEFFSENEALPRGGAGVRYTSKPTASVRPSTTVRPRPKRRTTRPRSSAPVQAPSVPSEPDTPASGVQATDLDLDQQQAFLREMERKLAENQKRLDQILNTPKKGSDPDAS